jgi:hypothetical protein
LGRRALVKGRLGEIKFQFNPTEDTDDGGYTWNEIDSPGMSKPLFQAGSGKPREITFDLYFNQKYSTNYGVKRALNLLIEYRNSTKSYVFTYGTFVGRVLIYGATIKITSRDYKLNPTEATASVSMYVL